LPAHQFQADRKAEETTDGGGCRDLETFIKWKSKKLTALAWGKAGWFALMLLWVTYFDLIGIAVWITAGGFHETARIIAKRFPKPLLNELKKRY
jgi:hypothetical protein